MIIKQQQQQQQEQQQNSLLTNIFPDIVYVDFKPDTHRDYEIFIQT